MMRVMNKYYVNTGRHESTYNSKIQKGKHGIDMEKEKEREKNRKRDKYKRKETGFQVNL